MARIRTIKPEFWTSEQIVECSPIARLLFIGMWNFCDDGGNHPASTKTLKMEVFPGDDISVSKLDGFVAELKSHGLLVEYAVESKRFWHVTGWHHQKIDRPNFKHPSLSDQGAIVEDSSNDRRIVVEQSPPEGKGRESKGRESKGEGARATRKCPSDFVVTEPMKGWAKQHAPLVNVESSTAAFLDHTFKTAITDWVGAWRNWIRRDQQYAADKQRPAGRRMPAPENFDAVNYGEIRDL